MKKGDRSPALAVAKVVDPSASANIATSSAKQTRSSKSTTNVRTASQKYDIQQNNDDDGEDDNDDESYNTAVDDDDDEDGDYKYTSDVDDYENISDLDDSEDELRTSFQKNSTNTKNRISGGPIPPDYSKMSEREAAIAATKYNKARKAYTDKLRHERVKGNKSTVTGHVDCTGVTVPRLRSIVEVENNRLMVGHSFPDKNILLLRVAEEANRRRIKIWTERSDHFNLIVIGQRFGVAARFIESRGWVVNLAAVRDGDDGMNKSIQDMISEFSPAGAKTTGEEDDDKKQPRTPYRMKWVADLIKSTIMDDPGTTNKVLRKVLEPYGYPYAFTESLLQDARKQAKLDLFGVADDNAMYADGVVSELRSLGHHV